MAPKGFQGTSLLDYPGKIASLIFYGGCNLSCPYCHNPGLVTDPDQYPDIALSDLMEELTERRRFIDGVVVSGGEPTLAKDLDKLLQAIKALGLEVKLDTNGLAADRLKQLLDGDLVDYVALDLKTRPERYGELHSVPVDTDQLHQTIELLRDGDTAYEVRTTCVPGLVDMDDIRAMGEVVRGSKTWALQQFVPAHAMDDKMRHLTPHSTKTLMEMASVAETYVTDLEVRGL